MREDKQDMKVAIIGANGQLGSDLCRVLAARGTEIIPLLHRDVDTADAAQVEGVLDGARPNVVISTAAYHKVDECEVQPERSFAVNAIGPMNLARVCQRIDALLVHFSTDYVFEGTQRRPYVETDLARPRSVYGTSKLAGECLVPSYCSRYFVIRTCGLYGVAGSAGKGGNFVETMLRKAAERAAIRVVNDQTATPTFTGDLAETVSRIIEPAVADRPGAYGLYHVTAEGQCSWYDFARKIFELEKLDVDLKPVSTAETFSPVQRPAYSVLSKQKLNGLGLSMPPWEEGLARYLKARQSQRKVTTPA
jgi:dTDP-4-dehydrorhamnose reductase